MRAAFVLTLFLAVLCAGCSGRPRYAYDEYPDPNGPRSDAWEGVSDLRGGDYDRNVGFGPLTMSAPQKVATSSVPDRPWIGEEPIVVNPVHPSVTPIDPMKLAALLPGAPEGWTVSEPNGNVVDTPMGRLTEASRNYWKGAAFKTAPTPDGRDLFPSVGLTIVDRGQTGPDAADPTDERRGVTLRNVSVEGFAGDEFDAGPGMKQVQVVVGDRFLVRARSGHVKLEELRGWVARVKLKDLAAMR